MIVGITAAERQQCDGSRTIYVDGGAFDDACSGCVNCRVAPRAEPATFAEFARQMEAILSPTAAGKGYSTTGVDGRNALYEFVQSFAGDGHALGEIVYKAKRYAAKGDPTELIKIASWAFLVWRHRSRGEAGD